MSPRHRRLVASLVTLAASATVAPRVRAGDGDPDASVRLDVSGLRASPAVAAAKGLWVPSDDAARDAWHGDGPDEITILPLEGPPFEHHAVGTDVVEDLVRRLVPESAGAGWASRASPDHLDIWSTKEGVDHARVAVRYVEGALAPRIAVRAVLTAAKGTAAPRLLAAGTVRLLPRRWTAAWQRTQVHRFATAYAIEIAQEATANEPVIAALPEGEELLLRWSPGERVHLVEILATDVAHGTPLAVDLSGIRQVPESNSPGPVELPQSAVRRVLTAITFDAKSPGTAECAWEAADGTRTLRLAVDAAPAAPADVELPTGAVGVVRAGAAYAALDGETREGRVDDAIQRYQAGATGGARSAASPETFAQAFLLCEGSRPQIERLRAQTVADEDGLATAVVDLRAVAVPAALVREDVEAGRLVVGALLDPTTAAPYLRAPVRAGVRLPTTLGLPAQLRCGTSVVGFAKAEVEIAQQAGGLVLDPIASFDGLAGRVWVRARDAGLVVQFAGAVAWASPDASKLALAFRRPLAMATSDTAAGGSRVDSPEVRTATFPLEGHGRALVDATATFGADDVAQGRVAVLAIAMHPGPDGAPEPLVLLASVRR